MSQAVLTLHFQSQDTLRNLECAAETLGVSVDELAEAVIARGLAAIGAGLGDKLTRSLEKLKSYTPLDLERDISAFAQSEVEIEDPVQARRVESSDAYKCRIPATACLEIPQETLDSARMTADQLLVELAVHLYSQGRFSIGKAHELAGLSLWEFRQILGLRQIPPQFEAEDLEQDLETLRQPGTRLAASRRKATL